ncbi:AbrB/MazE/SpoVT family DNA-binding domain-containing protein [soil metagenome]
MHESTITKRGQTTIPRQVRDALGLKAGDRLRYMLRDGEVRVVRVGSISALRGMLHRPGHRAVTLEEMDEAIATGAAETMGRDD